MRKRNRNSKGEIEKYFKSTKKRHTTEDERLIDPFQEDLNIDLSKVVNTNSVPFDAKSFEYLDSDNDDDDELYSPPKKCNNFVFDANLFQNLNNEDEDDQIDKLTQNDQKDSIYKKENKAFVLEPFETIVSAYEARTHFTMSPEQRDICKFVYDGSDVEDAARHLCIDSCAGSAKTSTLLQCLWFIPNDKKVLLLSFNKNIQNALQQAVNKCSVFVLTQLKREIPRCTTLTCHAHGFNALKTFFPMASQDAGVSDNKSQLVNSVIEKENDDVKKALEHWRWQLPKMLRLLLNLAVNCEDCPSLTEDFVRDVGRRYGIAVPEKNMFKRNNDHLMWCYMRVLEKSLQQCVQRTNNFDYNDMIYLPVYLNLPLMRYDYVLVDESQDLNAAQIELIRRSVEPEKGRVIFVGDQNQSIYGFRGVEMNAIEKVTQMFDATVLPLHTCWRCAKSVVEVAQAIVPRIKASPHATDGLATVRPEDELIGLLVQRDLNMTHAVLCRTNSPLIELSIQLMKFDIPYTLSAPSLRETLHSLANQVNDAAWLHSRNLLNKTNKFIEWKRKTGKEMGEEMIEKSDQLDSLRNIINSMASKGNASISQVHSQIDSVFGEIDDNNGGKNGCVRLSTIHSVKGMEFDCVYMIATRLLPHPSSKGSAWQRQQEENLKYVAFTRAKRELYYMQECGEDKDDDYNFE
jgi:superfamily I DNA/RNA helicase